MALTWQNTHESEPNYLDVCSEACVIAEPDGHVTVPSLEEPGTFVTIRRGERFENRRLDVGGFVGEGLSRGETPMFVVMPEQGETLDICQAVVRCIKRMEDGDCDRYLINQGQYPAQWNGLLSYSAALTSRTLPSQ